MKPQLSTCHTLTHSCRPIFQSVITFLCILLTASPAVARYFPENIWVWASRHKKLHSSPRMTGGCLVLLGYSGAYIYTSPRVDIVQIYLYLHQSPCRYRVDIFYDTSADVGHISVQCCGQTGDVTADRVNEVNLIPGPIPPPATTRAANVASRRIQNHREGPYQGLLLVESIYQCFHI